MRLGSRGLPVLKRGMFSIFDVFDTQVMCLAGCDPTFMQNQMAAAQTRRVTEITRKASLNAIMNASRITFSVPLQIIAKMSQPSEYVLTISPQLHSALMRLSAMISPTKAAATNPAPSESE
jgi:hypothetical protein